MKTENKRTDARIMDLVSNEARFTRFNAAIRSSGLGEKFVNSDNCTVFAPTDAAFAKLPQSVLTSLFKPENRKQLRQLLLLHLAPVALKADDLNRVAALRTIGGQELLVTVSPDRQEIKLGNAKVLLPTELAKNGVLYPLDDILLPAAGKSARV